MKQLRRAFVTLIIALAAIFIFQWPNSIQETTLGLESFVFFLILIVVAVQLALPRLSRNQHLLLTGAWLTLFFILKITIFAIRPLFGGIHSYVTIFSVGVIVGMNWLAWRCACAMGDLEQSIRHFLIGRHGNQIHDASSAQAIVQAEMLRSRNFKRPLSVISLRTPDALTQAQLGKLAAEIERSVAEKLAYEQLADLVGQHTRRTDIVILDKVSGQLVLLCPETDGSAAREVATNLAGFVNERLQLNLRWGTASFPDEALSYQSLVDMAAQSATGRNTDPQRPATLPVSGNPLIQGE